MKTFLPILSAVGLALSVFLVPLKAVAAEIATADQAEAQARGPIHEAFAQPSDMPLKAGPIVPKQPPAPVPEEPPDQKPAGDNFQWINGYWAWNDDSQDFLWVSGTWRATPQGRKWVPGYWNQAGSGWQWVSGFWAPASQASITYQEPPPASLENGPSAPAPDDNTIYVSGNWVYSSTRYVWRPGYWMRARPGYVWNPASYLYTPNGSVYVNGYWDYPLENRGILFAPVVFTRPWWTNPAWVYRPRYWINSTGLLASLFVRPGWGHYYFGDYYGSPYLRRGYSPWLAFGRRYNDPLFGYYRWTNRGNPGWYAGLRSTYQGRLNGTLPRPGRTLVQQGRVLAGARGNVTSINNLNIVRPFNQIGTSFHTTHLSASQVAGFRTSAGSIRGLSVKRHELERSRHIQGNLSRSAGTSRIGPAATIHHVEERHNPVRTNAAHGSAVHSGHAASRIASSHVRRPAASHRHVAARTTAHVSAPTRFKAAHRSAPGRTHVASRARTRPAHHSAPAHKSGGGHGKSGGHKH
jgi:hypothetical protein